MANITRLDRYPNVLLVTGNEFRDTDYRFRLLRTLSAESASTSPVSRGTHNMWIAYYLPRIGVQSEAGLGYNDPEAAPNRLRSIAHMDNPFESVSGQVGTMLQEIGHRWLVPRDFMVGDVTPMTSGEFTEAVNAGRPTSRPLLLGRGDNHWGTFFNADASPFDGVGWANAGIDDGITRWDQRSVPVPDLVRTAMSPLNCGVAYNDFDRFIMGVKRADEGYPATAGRFQWIEPRVIAPLQYHVGIFVAFSPADYIYFGFYGDPRRLLVERSTMGGGVRADVGLDYHPFSQEFGAMMLRVVRRGNRYYFQGRHGNSAIAGWQAIAALFGGPPPPTNAPGMFDQLDRPLDSTEGSFSDFRTIATWDETARPLAVGVIVKTWNAILVEGGFFTFELRDGDRDIAMPMSYAQPLPMDSTLSDLGAGTLYRHQPYPGSWIRLEHSRVMAVGTPYSDNYNHWSGVDRAPKLLTRAPDGDFVFGASTKVKRAMYTPWAAGAAAGSSIWGVERSASLIDVALSDATRAEQLTWPSTLKGAFMIAAPTPADIPDSVVQTVDQVRQYYEEAFSNSTDDRVRFDTRLEPLR